MKRLLYIFLMLFTLAACKETVYLSEQDTNRDLSIDVGQSVVITLSESNVTGYEWYFRIEPFGQTAISSVRKKFTISPKKLLGASGEKEFTFKSRKPGRAVIIGEYRRAWEKWAPTRSVRFFINVQ